jgi:hypothetical protein
VSLFAAWLVHDAEEAVTFPATSRRLADRLNARRLVVTPAQSVLAITLVGALVAAACVRGARTGGGSRLFRAVAAGLEAHTVTHVAASVLLGQYTAGLVTAPLVMLPGARKARAALRDGGTPLLLGDTVRGSALMLAAALLAHVAARTLLPAQPRTEPAMTGTGHFIVGTVRWSFPRAGRHGDRRTRVARLVR